MFGLVFARPRICLCWFECLKCLPFCVCLSDSICLLVRASVCKSKNLSLLVWMSKVSNFLCLCVRFFLYACLVWCLHVQEFVFVGLNVYSICLSLFLCLILFVCMSGLVFTTPSICLCWFECLKCLSFSVCVSDSISLHVWVGVCKSKYMFLLAWMSKVSVILCLCVWFYLFACLGWCLQVQVFVFVGLNV
jgi:hypothetical protein